MPITKSAKKSLRVSQTKRAQNLAQEKNLEKALRTVSEETVNHVVSLVDKAAKTHLIHENKAARIKSQLAKKIAAPKAEAKPVKAKSVKPKTAKKTTKKK